MSLLIATTLYGNNIGMRLLTVFQIKESFFISLQAIGKFTVLSLINPMQITAMLNSSLSLLVDKDE